MVSNNYILKALRLKHGETQEQCAKRLKVTQHTVSMWESTKTSRLGVRQMNTIYLSYKIPADKAIRLAEQYVSDVKACPRTKPPIKPVIDDCGNQVLGFDSNGEVISRRTVVDALIEGRELSKEECFALQVLINCKGVF